MKRYLLFICCLQVTLAVYAQKEDQILLKIDKENITVQAFKEVYEKNLDLITLQDDKEVDKNLDLFINYKLKVREAYRLKLDTLKSYRREIETYKNQLYAPYLKDQEILDSLIYQAYQRSKEEIKASHILVRLAKDAKPADTLKAYNKISSARERILKGEPFDRIAKEFSEDRSVINNGGDLGYFTVFKMIKDFEDVAYQTQVGSISQPFKTQFGYHIIKVVERRSSRGEREVAHILITGDKAKGKRKIDSVYKLIVGGVSFEEMARKISDDRSSKGKGGKLPKISSGSMIPAMDKAAFGIDKINEVSKPFETRFGWHLLKLLKKYPIRSFDSSKEKLSDDLKRKGRYKLSRELMVQKLRKRYRITENEKAKEILNNTQLFSQPIDSFGLNLFSIEDKSYTQRDFVEYIKNRRHKTVIELYDMFINEKVLEYYKDNLIYQEPEFAKTLKEYQEGLLLFELMQNSVWEKSLDSTALSNFYEERKLKSQYTQPLDSIKGIVINDFQKAIESEWMDKLRANSIIKINNRILRKIRKKYAKNRSK